jgi:hypothetical protein
MDRRDPPQRLRSAEAGVRASAISFAFCCTNAKSPAPAHCQMQLTGSSDRNRCFESHSSAAFNNIILLSSRVIPLREIRQSDRKASTAKTKASCRQRRRSRRLKSRNCNVVFSVQQEPASQSRVCEVVIPCICWPEPAWKNLVRT